MKIQLLQPDAIAPTRAHSSDAGLDLYSLEEKVLVPCQRYLFRHGFAMEIPDGFFGLIRPRSGLAATDGITLCSSGVIDSDYRGEVMTCLINLSQITYVVHKGDRISQLIIVPCLILPIELGGKLSPSNRGTSGHGSTGK